MINGIDVSHWQSKLDYAKLLANDIRFVICKAGEIPLKSKQEFLDDMYSRNIREAKSRGIISGAYYFFHPSIGASRQARHFKAIMDNYGYPDLPPVIDVEVTDAMQPQSCAAVLKAMIDRMVADGLRKPIIYTRNGLWVNQYGNPDWGVEHFFWLAQYPKMTNKEPKIRDNIIMHQWTDRGRIPGIGVNLDLNYWLKSDKLLWELANNIGDNPPIDTSEKLYCEYCGGYTFDDSRGNCGACGAPRTPISHAYKRALITLRNTRTEDGVNIWNKMNNIWAKIRNL